MNPHFLFNALNAIVACKDSPEDVARVTQDLLSTFSDTAPGRHSRSSGSP
jgi:LytS/YehU family sensor histidine kinase